MKQHSISRLFLFIAIVSTLLIAACKKINEATTLGDGLIPAVDNITTFEQYLEVEADNKLFLDSTKVLSNDIQAVGDITADPEFGSTHADGYFDISAPIYGSYPFGANKDSIEGIDSVVLSLRCSLHYGDSNSLQTLRVFEIAQNSGFNDTTYNKYFRPTDFSTFGPELGSKTFVAKSYKDSIRLFRKAGDTTKVSNVIRITLNNSFATRLANYDTGRTSLSGAYFSDSAFKKAFRGFAIKADNGGRAINYIEPSDISGSGLIVYCRIKRAAGVKDTASVVFSHQNRNGIGGQANIIRKTPGGNWASYLGNALPNDDKLYVTAVPGGYASLRIPALDTFRNSVIHLAQLVATPIPSVEQGKFVFPGVLFLDAINNANDTAFSFDSDMGTAENLFSNQSFAYNANRYGGFLKSDSTYRFNITRHVQSRVTRATRNFTLRLYAPVRADLYSNALNIVFPNTKGFSPLFVGNAPAFGRIVLAGGNYADTPKRLRLRVVYSKI